MRPGLVTLALLAGMLSATSLVAEPRRETAPTSGRARLGERRALLLGYRFHHISNAGPGEINPSVNSNFFYAGLSILR